MIPLKISGTFADPSYAVDLEKAGKRVIKKEADKLIDKLLKKKESDDSGGSGKEKLDPAELLKGLDKLF